MNFFILLVFLGLGYIAWMLFQETTGYSNSPYLSGAPQSPGDALFTDTTTDTSSEPASYSDSSSTYDCSSSSSGGCDAV